jgi:galacturonosyltransferase
MVKNNFSLLPGSGVNLEQYHYSAMPLDSEVNFIFIGRIMELKGINEFLSCAKYIKQKYSNTNFYVAGFIEEKKYDNIIAKLSSEGIINFVGFQKDIKSLIKKCHCTILPSYGGEGVPNVLLETCAIGRICLASKIHGSEDVIEDGLNGFLFESGNIQELIVCVEKVINLTYEEKRIMGAMGRDKVEKQFDRNIIIKSYLQEIEMLGD